MRSTFARVFPVTILGCAAALATACRDVTSPASVSAIVVVNATADSIAVMVLELESSHLIDPIGERLSAAEGDRRIAPGSQRRVPLSEISGYTVGKDIRLFVYRIRAGRSVLAGGRDASAAALRADRYTVLITASVFAVP